MAKGCGHYLCGLANAECDCPPALESNRAGDILQAELDKLYKFGPGLASIADGYKHRYLFLVGVVNGLADESEMFDLAIRRIAANLEKHK